MDSLGIIVVWDMVSMTAYTYLTLVQDKAVNVMKLALTCPTDVDVAYRISGFCQKLKP